MTDHQDQAPPIVVNSHEETSVHLTYHQRRLQNLEKGMEALLDIADDVKAGKRILYFIAITIGGGVLAALGQRIAAGLGV